MGKQVHLPVLLLTQGEMATVQIRFLVYASINECTLYSNVDTPIINYIIKKCAPAFF